MKSKELLYQWIGKRISEARQEKNLSQTELAKLVELSRGSVANIEKGRQQPPLHVLWSITDALEISVEKVIPFENEHLTPDNPVDILSELEKSNTIDTNEKHLIRELNIMKKL